MSKEAPSTSERRTFLSRLNAGAATLAALALGGAAKAQAKPATRWEPARHEKDDWMDQMPGKHRLVFDTIVPDGLGHALLFASNFISVNRSDYGLQNNDLAVIIVVRYRSVAFAFNDSIWAKYSAPIAKQSSFEDPKSKAAANINVFNSDAYGDQIPSRGATLGSLTKQGVQLGVCSVATRNLAAAIAGATGGEQAAVFAELTSNLLPNARLVPAGIVAVSRAQERGYTLVTG